MEIDKDWRVMLPCVINCPVNCPHLLIFSDSGNVWCELGIKMPGWADFEEHG